MRRYLSLLVISNLLTGCIYADGCFYTPQMVNCVDKGTEFPYIAFFQKKGEIGHTNVNVRWNDVADCGTQAPKRNTGKCNL